MSYDDRDWVGELLSSPTKAEVETQFALPDLSDTVQGLSAMDAFKEFLDYAKRAAGLQFSRALYRALERELYITNKKIRDNGQHYYPMPTELQFTDRSKRIQYTLSARIAPLLPAIREYISQRPRDPAIINRLAWLADQVEVVLVQDYPPRGLPRMGCVEWRTLKKGILEIIATPPQPDPMATTGTTATQGTTEQPVAPIQWKGSVQQLAWVLRELAEKGWIGYPAQKGHTTKWKAGDINASAFAKAMAPHFKEVKEKTLAQELKPGGGTVPAADVEGWEIPKRPE